MPASIGLALRGVHHIAIICTDYAVSKRFYTEVLGLEIIREVHRAARDSYKLDLALGGQYVIELFSFPTPRRAPATPRRRACAIWPSRWPTWPPPAGTWPRTAWPASRCGRMS